MRGVRQKLESGQTTKEQILDWLRNGGGQASKRRASGKQYYGEAVDVRDPSEFLADRDPADVVYSGPQAGERLPPFVVTGLRGPFQGREFDPVAASVGAPSVIIFQDNSVVGQKGLLLAGPALERIAERAPDGLFVWTTFLVDDPSPRSIFEYDFMDEIVDVVQMGVSSEGRDGPGVYGLNRNVAMTILVARDGVVRHNFAFPQPMLYPDPHVMGAIAQVVGVDRETLAGWLRGEDSEAAPKSAYGDDERSGRPGALKRRLGELVEKGRLTKEEAAELYLAAFPEQAK